MRVVVVGAGIGGSSTALALRRQGHEVVVLERVRENRPVGAALSLWPNGVKVLNWLGLGEQVASMGGRMDDMAYLDGITGEQLCSFSLAPVTSRSGQRPYPVARAELQALLIDAVGQEHVRLGQEVVRVEQDERSVTAVLADGRTETADLLVAADGARSGLRGHVAATSGEHRERTYAGYTNYNGLVAADERVGPLTRWTTYVGEGKRCSVMPVGGGRFYFFVDVPQPAGLPYDRERDGVAPLREAFGAWEAPGVRVLLDAVDPATSLNRVEIHDMDPLSTWVRGRVALLGDAAHPTTPDIGQGACSALEDSFALATVLATTTLGVPDALLRYQQVRAERAADLVLRARRRAHETHGADPALTRAWYEGLRHEDGTGVVRGILGNVEGSPVDLGGGLQP